MFPPEITETVTLYSFWRDDGGNQTMKRTVLKNVFFNPNSISVFVQTGQQVPTSVDIFIPYDESVTGKRYLSPAEWYGLDYGELENYYTLDLRHVNFTRIVRGESEFEFGLGTALQLSQRMADFSGPNGAEYDAYQPRDVNVQVWQEGVENFIRVRV
jgi:hypothetical protein